MVCTDPEKAPEYLTEKIKQYYEGTLIKQPFNYVIDQLNKKKQHIKLVLQIYRTSDPKVKPQRGHIKKSKEICKSLELVIDNLSKLRDDVVKKLLAK